MLELWRIGHKFIDYNKRKANIIKLFSEEFDEIQEDLYPINPTSYDVISNCYESISLKEDILK